MRKLKNIFLILIVLCLVLTGCSSKKEKSSSAIDVAQRYNINLDEIDLDYSKVNGSFETLTFYMSKKIDDTNRKENFVKILDYLKKISDDNKIYDYYENGEFLNDEISYLTVNTTVTITINDANYKVSLFEHDEVRNDDKTYSTYEIMFEEL